MSHKLGIHSFICLFTFLIYFQPCICDKEIPLVFWTQLLGGIKSTNKSGYLWHFKSSFHNLQHCRKLTRPGFNPNGALWRCWCIVFSADHLFLMAKQRQNEKAPVCGGTNRAENLLSAPSRHLFSTTFPYQILSEDFPANHSNRLISPQLIALLLQSPIMASIPSVSPVGCSHFTLGLPHSGAPTDRQIWNIFSSIPGGTWSAL